MYNIDKWTKIFLKEANTEEEVIDKVLYSRNFGEKLYESFNKLAEARSIGASLAASSQEMALKNVLSKMQQGGTMSKVQIAKDPNTPKEVLIGLSISPSDVIKSALMSNPSLPSEVKAKLMSQHSTLEKNAAWLGSDGGIDWADKFKDTPFYLEALQLSQENNQYEQEKDMAYENIRESMKEQNKSIEDRKKDLETRLTEFKVQSQTPAAQETANQDQTRIQLPAQENESQVIENATSPNPQAGVENTPVLNQNNQGVPNGQTAPQPAAMQEKMAGWESFKTLAKEYGPALAAASGTAGLIGGVGATLGSRGTNVAIDKLTNASKRKDQANFKRGFYGQLGRDAGLRATLINRMKKARSKK